MYRGGVGDNNVLFINYLVFALITVTPHRWRSWELLCTDASRLMTQSSQHDVIQKVSLPWSNSH